MGVSLNLIYILNLTSNIYRLTSGVYYLSGPFFLRHHFSLNIQHMVRVVTGIGFYGDNFLDWTFLSLAVKRDPDLPRLTFVHRFPGIITDSAAAGRGYLIDEKWLLANIREIESVAGAVTIL